MSADAAHVVGAVTDVRPGEAGGGVSPVPGACVVTITRRRHPRP